MGDRGDIVLGWLTKLVVVLGVLGVVGFDLISLGSTRFQAEDHAQAAARAAVESYRSGQDLQAAYDAAVAEVAPHGDTVEASTFTVDPQGQVTLTLHRTAPTMVVEKVAPLRHWAQMTSTVTGRRAV
jgi:Tfp pilus assembly protein PilV